MHPVLHSRRATAEHAGVALTETQRTTSLRHPPVNGDSVKRMAAGTKFFVAPLSPAEKEVFTGAVSRTAMGELCEHLAAGDKKRTRAWLQAQTGLAINEKVNISNLMRSVATQLPPTICNDTAYDYFEELKNQYRRYLDGERRGDYLLIQSGEDMNPHAWNEGTPPDIVFALNGIHALGVGNPESDAENSHAKDVSVGRIKSRIRQLKGEESLEDSVLKKWEHCPLLFRLAGHFGNGFFGHARSFSENASIFLDQRKFLNKGLLGASSYEIVQELLGLDEHLQPTGSRRILIDMLHLSARSRNDLYQGIYRQFNKNVDPIHPIPVVFTAAAYSGVDYLTEMIRCAAEGIENESARINGYAATSLNLTDEDVLAVFWSQGLIALSLEEIKIGSGAAGWSTLFPASSRSRALRYLRHQIAGIVSVPFAYQLANPLAIWECLSIGNGLAGDTEYIERYTDTGGMRKLPEDVEEVLTGLKKEEPMWFGGYKPGVLAQKICERNVAEFVLRNY